MDADLRNHPLNQGPGYFETTHFGLSTTKAIKRVKGTKINSNKARTIHRQSFRLWFIGSSHRLIVLLLTVLHILHF